MPDAAKLFITGNVKSPGVYRITDSEGSSVLKAMALSQGTFLTQPAKHTSIGLCLDRLNVRKSKFRCEA